MREVEAAIAGVERSFPIPGYTRDNVASYRTVASVALRHLSPGDRILDIGSGPCDKIALLGRLGFRGFAVDDLNDPWHREGDTTRKILEFARSEGIDFRVATASSFPFQGESFDMVMLCDVLEHLHESPRELLATAIGALRPNGFLLITVPNAVNLRKRIDVLIGRTNLPPFDEFYWSRGEWRGHVREYVWDDLERIARYQGLDIVELRGVNHMLQKLPSFLRQPFVHATYFAQGLRDSLLLVARRPAASPPVPELERKELRS